MGQEGQTPAPGTFEHRPGWKHRHKRGFCAEFEISWRRGRNSRLPIADRCGCRLRHLHARPGRPGVDLEFGCSAAQRLRARGDHRSQLQPLLYARGSKGRRTPARPGHGEAHGPIFRRRLARSQGWEPVLGDGRHRRYSRRPGDDHRVRQGHARYHRAARSGARPAGKRAALPPSRRGGGRLCDLSARPEWCRRYLERRRATHQGLHSGRNNWRAFQPLLYGRRPEFRPAATGTRKSGS